MIFLLLHKCKVHEAEDECSTIKPGYQEMKTLPINAFFVNSKQWLQVMFIYQSFLVLTI